MQRVVLIVISAAVLAGCGTQLGDRGLSGATIGAGVGVLGGPPGIVVGAVAGAGIAMVTKPSQVNLGKPFWER
jgi:hypothetical protein